MSEFYEDYIEKLKLDVEYYQKLYSEYQSALEYGPRMDMQDVEDSIYKEVYDSTDKKEYNSLIPVNISFINLVITMKATDDYRANLMYVDNLAHNKFSISEYGCSPSEAASKCFSIFLRKDREVYSEYIGKWD